MKKWALLLAIFWGGVAFGQAITITGTVKDPTGILYQNGSGRVQLVPTNTQWTVNNGYPVNQTVWVINNLDAFGHFSIQLPSTLSYDQQSSNPQYQFSFCSASYPTFGPICFTMTPLTLTTSQDISSQIQAQSAPLPQPSSAIILVNGVGILNPNIVNSPCILWTVALGSQISGSLAPGCSGGGGGGSSVSVNGIGVATPNFLNTSAFQFVLAGSNITGVPVAQGGEGAIAVNHNNLFAAVANFGLDSGLSPTTFTNGYVLSQLATVQFAGPNPTIDITAPPYNVRAVGSSFGTTAVCTATSTSVTLTVASNFQNNDGIDLQNCGTANGLSTPVAPTVTPVEAIGPIQSYHNVSAPSGSTTYQYQITAIAFGKGYTPAGTATVITTGNPIGKQTATVTSFTRTGGTSTTATVVTSATQTIVSGSTVILTGSSDTGCNGGPFLVTSTPNGSAFVIVTGDSVIGGATASCTGGTVTWYQGNHLSWTASTGSPMQYAIYGRTSGSNVFLGLTRIGETQWDDYGDAISKYSAPYSWLPTTPPASGLNNDLVTTIVSGAPGTSIVVANAASNSSSGQNAVFDAAPGTRAAALVATANGSAGTLHWPAPPAGGQYIYNSSLDLNTGLGGNQIVNIEQSAQITANMPWQLHRGAKWYGDRAGAGMNLGSFAWEGCPQFVVGTAFPAVYYPGATFGDVIDCVSFQNANNNGLNLQIMGNGGFNFTIRNSYILNGSGNNDLSGLAFAAYGMANMKIDSSYLAASTPVNNYGITTAPVGLMVNDLTNTNGAGSLTAKDSFTSTRGYAAVSVPAVGGGVQYTYNGITYDQGADAPILAVDTSGRQNFVEVRNCTNDTGSSPVVVNISGNTSLIMQNCGPPGTGIPYVSGQFTGAIFQNNAIPAPLNNADYLPNDYGLNQSADYNIPIEQVNPMAPYNTTNASSTRYAVREMREFLRFPAQHAAYWDLLCPTTVTATPTTGGNISAGTYYYQVSCVGAPIGSGGESAISPPSNACVLSGANNACALSWTAVTNAVAYNTYRCITSNCSGTVNGTGGPSGELHTTNSYTDTVNSLNGNYYPAMNAGAGNTAVKYEQIISPQFTLISGLGAAGVSYTGVFTAPSFSSNHVFQWPDASGVPCVTGLLGCDYTLDTGVANVYAICPAPIPVPNLIIGQHFTWQAANQNGGASTLNVCSTGAHTIKKNGGTGGSVGADLVSQDIKAGMIIEVGWDGTNFQVLSQLGNAGAGSGTVNTSGSPAANNLTCFSGALLITNCNLTGDVTSVNAVTTVAKIQGVIVNTASVAQGQILTVDATPQYINKFPGVNYNPQTTTYSIACPGDRLGYVDFTGSAATTFTLAQANSTACTGSSASYFVHNGGTAALTLAATTSTIDGIAGATGVQILPGEARLIYEDPGSPNNYHTTHVRAAFGGVNTQIAGYTLLPSDFGKTVIMNCASACAVTMPNPPPITDETAAGTRWNVRVLSIGASLATISLNSLTFNGSASVPILNKYIEQDFYTDGSNYFGSAPLVASTNVTFTPAPQGLSISASGGGGGGTVTQVNTSGCLSGGPITTTGTITSNTCVYSAAVITNKSLVVGNDGVRGTATSGCDEGGTTTGVFTCNDAAGANFQGTDISVGTPTPLTWCDGGSPGGSQICAAESTPATDTTANVERMHASSVQHAWEAQINNADYIRLRGNLCTNVTPVTVAVSTTADQNLIACTLKAGDLNTTLRTLSFRLYGIYSTPAASVATVTMKVKFCTVSGCGSGTVITPLSITSGANPGSVTNNAANLRGDITTQTAGASAAFEAHGSLLIDLGALTTAADSTYADTNTATVGTIDSTGQLFLQTSVAFSVASASNSYTARQLIVDVEN